MSVIGGPAAAAAPHEDERFWIKDLDGGRVYVLEDIAEKVAQFEGTRLPHPNLAGGGGAAGGGPVGGAGRVKGDGGGTDSAASAVDGGREGRVRELLSGKQLSLLELDESLGYRAGPAHPPPAPGPSARSRGGAAPPSPDGDDRPLSGGAGEGGEAGAGPRAGGAATPGHVRQGSWISRVAGRMGGGSEGGAGPRSDGGGPGSTSSGGEPPYPSTSRPVHPSTSKGPPRALAGLRSTQRLDAHAGVIWALEVSRDGRYLASAGQDCVVRVWSVAGRGTRGGGGSSDARARGAAGGEARAVPAAAAGGEAAPPASRLKPQSGSVARRPYAPLLLDTPLRAYAGHTQDVLDVSWSHTGFLLSGSMDKSVRLWHVSLDECLRVFRHSDFVTAVCFNPLDDRDFFSGSIDGRLRRWSVPDGRVTAWHDVHEMITAAAVSPDGSHVVVGSMKGRAKRFVAGPRGSLEYEATVDVRDSGGTRSRGKKVTGVCFLPVEGDGTSPPPSAAAGAEGARGGGARGGASAGATRPPGAASSDGGGRARPLASAGLASGSLSPIAPPPPAAPKELPMLVTSNDSRIRLYHGLTLRVKFKGHANSNTQIRASFSPDARLVICGSDDGRVVVWAVPKSAFSGTMPEGTPREKIASHESFLASTDATTVAIFAPTSLAAPGGGRVILAAGYGGSISVYETRA